jgi:hypothetical protein
MTDAPREITVEEIDEFEHWVCQIYAKSKRAKAICALARRALSQAGGEREVCKQHPDGCFVHPAPDTPQSVPTCTCSKHPLWDGYDGDCPIHGWFEPVAPDTPQSIPAAGDDELAVRAERDKLKEELTAEIKLGDARSAECHALRAERDKLKEDCSNLSASRAALFNERNALVERVSVLEKVIERISKASNTDPFRTFDGMIQDMQMIDDIARAALRTSEGA